MSQLILVNGGKKLSLFAKAVRNFTLGPYFLLSSMVGFVALITIITLVFSTRQVTKGYVLNSLDTNHQELTKQLEKNEMMISEVRSLTYIQDTDKVKTMIRPGAVVFVEGDTAIASR